MTCCCCFSLDALDPDAYEAFQASNNLSDVVQRCLQKKQIKAGVLPGMSKKLSEHKGFFDDTSQTHVGMYLWCKSGSTMEVKKNL